MELERLKQQCAYFEKIQDIAQNQDPAHVLQVTRAYDRAVKIPGAVVVVAALAGGTLLGILGALIAIPVAASILLIVKQVIVPRQNEL